MKVSSCDEPLSSYQRLDLFIKVLRVLCPNLTDASLISFRWQEILSMASSYSQHGKGNRCWEKEELVCNLLLAADDRDVILFPPAASRIGITHWPTCLSLFSKASALLLNLVLGCNRQAQEIHYLAVSDDMVHTRLKTFFAVCNPEMLLRNGD